METLGGVQRQRKATKMQGLTKRQHEVLEWIKRDAREHGVPPTRTEVAHGLGLADASSVRAHLQRLEEAGYIQSLPSKNRAIRVVGEEIPVIGRLAEVAAGTPIVCEENIVQRIPALIADHFRPRPDYLLTVRGDSMDRTGLRDSDVVAVRKSSVADTGQVVIARFGDEVTLKRFVRIDDRHVELRPESYNAAHEVLKLDLAKHILEVDGVVVGALIKDLRDAHDVSKQGNRRPRAIRMRPKTEL